MTRQEVVELLERAPEDERVDLSNKDLRDVGLWGLDLSGAYLRGAGLRSSNLQGADLTGVDLRHADLASANLSHADLASANLRSAGLSGANLVGAKLRGADLSSVDLSGADLYRANLSSADMRGAKLNGASLRSANLTGADLRDAYLPGAYLRSSNLSGTNLSGVEGLSVASDYLEEHFETDSRGVIVYKVFNVHHEPPEHWTIEEGAVLEEVVNSCRADQCGCGVNVATREWVERKNSGRKQVWKCCIRWKDLAGVVVPYSTEGEVRAERVKLLEKL